MLFILKMKKSLTKNLSWSPALFSSFLLCFQFSTEYFANSSFFLLFFSIEGKKTSAGGGGVWRWCGRGFCHRRRHDGRRSHGLGFLLLVDLKNGAHQWADWLQAASQACHTANTVWKFTVLGKSTFLPPAPTHCQNVKLLYFFSVQFQWSWFKHFDHVSFVSFKHTNVTSSLLVYDLLS